MAEYVRRRRPPASHPYWERLNDRAHPPRLFLRIAIPSLIGLLLGLYGGLRSPFSINDAVHLAATSAAIVSTLAFALCLPRLLIGDTRHLPHGERWPITLALGLMFTAICFAAGFVIFFLLFNFYSLCSGRGPWLGMLIGLSPFLILASLFSIGARKRWRDRQRAWPRWSQMRIPRSRSRSVTAVWNPTEEVEPAEVSNDDAGVEVSESPSPEPGPTTSSSPT